MDFLNTMTDAQFAFWYGAALLAIAMVFGVATIALERRKAGRRRVKFITSRVQ